ncbi:MAG TPA: Ig-like domain-containing protein [Terriglobales bacterium]|nr:Ig-like domain-containing protein [Terriglobales bacterium]
MRTHISPSSSPQVRSLVPIFVTSAVALTLILAIVPAVCQVSVLTQHYDNARTGQNTQETILTPANVNANGFGLLFSYPLDGQMAAQPLYVPNVYIPALNATHNVVYAVTMHDSIYAFDADNNQGSNAQPLWFVNLLDADDGVTTVPLVDEKCRVTGYSEFGIQGTPVIDTTRHAIYFLAMTKENGTYVHRLHALDLGTGQELFGGPATISASVVINGETYTFIDRYQQQRPGLLLQNGIVYVGFGGPGCNIKTENGWVMAYNADNLQPMGAFDVSPDVQASAIWQSGAGLAGDDNGNVFFSTGDGLFDGPGGTHFGDTALKLTQVGNTLTLGDYFTPYNQLFFQENDLDLSSSFVTLLPVQPNGGHYALATDKDGTAYILNQTDLGQYNPAGDFQIPQELDVPVQGEVHAGQTYWNNNVYIAAEGTPIMAYSFNNGQLSSQPTSQTPKATANPTGGIVSSNGTQNAIFWHATFPTSKLFAYDATNLATEFYDSGMNQKRDGIPEVVHFAMPVVANGRVYLNGQTQLSVFGLLVGFTPLAGNNQTGQIGSQLPIALEAGLVDPYTHNPIHQAGIPVTFTVSPRGGSFSNPTTQTDANGTVSTYYTLPKTPGTYIITASSPNYASAIFTVTATTGAPESMVIASGNNQSAPVTTSLKSPLKVKVKDAQGNPVVGISISFSDNDAGGTLTPATATTDSAGIASTTYTTGTKAGIIAITASTAGVAPVSFKATVLAGPPASMAVYAGNNQTVKTGQSTSKQLQVLVEDQYTNVVKGAQVSYSDNGAGGSFLPNPAITSSKGIAGSRYTAPMQEGTVTVTASCPGANTVQFTVNVD